MTGRVGSGRVGSGRVGSGRVGSGRVGSGRVRGVYDLAGRDGFALTRPDLRKCLRNIYIYIFRTHEYCATSSWPA